ncbi:MAG: hypothetical protein WC325_11500 [Candidatus Bathyarchaeia archaeon]|jgi:hypothetical protein
MEAKFVTGLELAKRKNVDVPKKKPSTYNPEKNARSRALVRQAVYAYPGMTYKGIRKWLRENKNVEMENVGARVREMDGRNSAFKQYVRTETDALGHVFVYPFFGEDEI